MMNLAGVGLAELAVQGLIKDPSHLAELEPPRFEVQLVWLRAKLVQQVVPGQQQASDRPSVLFQVASCCVWLA